MHKRSGLSDDKYDAFLEHSKTTHAMGRVGTVDEVAKTIAFLASDSASFITGQTLAIDGRVFKIQYTQRKYTLHSYFQVVVPSCAPDDMNDFQP